jgi:hypothetical protein
MSSVFRKYMLMSWSVLRSPGNGIIHMCVSSAVMMIAIVAGLLFVLAGLSWPGAYCVLAFALSLGESWLCL